MDFLKFSPGSLAACSLTLAVVSQGGLAATVCPPTGSQLCLGYAQTSTGTTATGNSNGLVVPGSYGYTNTYMAGSGVTPIAGSPGGFGFYDDYVFMISSASANSVTATISEGAALAITNLNARIYSTAGLATLPVLGAVSGEVDSSNSTIGGLTVATIGTTLLNPGTYVLEIRGTASGSSGGTYSGVLNLTTPVPLPAALSLLLPALGGLGLIRRKRAAEGSH